MSAEETQRPRVKYPISAEHEGLSVDGTFVYAVSDSFVHPGDEAIGTHPQGPFLPERANEAYYNYVNTDNNGWVYQCQDCGYLTMSKHARVSTNQSYECPNCKDEGSPGVTNFTRVYPRESLKTVPEEHKDEVYVDVLELTADDVPNHKSHLGRIQSQLENHVTQSQLLDIAADAVADAREQGYIDY